MDVRCNVIPHPVIHLLALCSSLQASIGCWTDCSPGTAYYEFAGIQVDSEDFTDTGQSADEYTIWLGDARMEKQTYSVQLFTESGWIGASEVDWSAVELLEASEEQ